MPCRSLQDLITQCPKREVTVTLGQVVVPLDVYGVSWQIPGSASSLREFKLLLPIRLASREQLWRQRTHQAFDGAAGQARGVVARAWLETHRTSAMQGLGFAKTFGKKHLRPKQATGNQIAELGLMSGSQLATAGAQILTKSPTTLEAELLRAHFPGTAHSVNEQLQAAAFLDEQESKIMTIIRGVWDDVGIEAKAQKSGKRDEKINEHIRSRLQAIVRRAAKIGVSTSALHREALLRTIETDVADAQPIRAFVLPALDSFGVLLFDLIHIGHPRGDDPRLLVPPMASSPAFRTFVELFGGFVHVPQDMLILPDLIDVLAGANPSHYRSSICKALGFARMSVIWREQKRQYERGRSAKARLDRILDDDPLGENRRPPEPNRTLRK